MKLSIAMMVKNESKHLDECLSSLDNIRKNISSELIIVDTGSNDNTVEIAKKYTDKVYFHKWNNNFSEMRNITIDYCNGKWILIIDGDEVIDNTGNILEFFASEKWKKFNTVSCIVKNLTNEEQEECFSISNGLRFFKNDGNFHYEGVVHNEPVCQMPIFNSSMELKHYGYISTDKQLMERKFKRTATLLIQELSKDPDNIYYLYQLSTSYAMHNDYEEAVIPMERAYKLIKNDDILKEQYIYLYSQMALVYMKINKNNLMEQVCFEGIKIKKDFVDLYYFLAFAQFNLQKYEQALVNFKNFLKVINDINKNKNYPSFEYYTLGLKNDAYIKMAHSLYNMKQYENSINYIKQIEEKYLTESGLQIFIKSCIKLDKYKSIYSFFSRNINEENKKKKYINILINEINKKDLETQKEIIKEFVYDKQFNVLFKVKQYILEENFNLDNKFYDEICKIQLKNVDDNYGEIIYYLLKCNKSLKDILNVRESKIYELLKYISNQYIDLSKVIYEYLKKNNDKSLSNIRIDKVLAKLVLLLNDLPKEQYKEVMYTFLHLGIQVLTSTYRDEIIENEIVDLLKDSEDAFLLYVYKAESIKEINSKQYINYLRKALHENEFYKKIIETMLEDFQVYKNNNDNTVTSEQSELESYKIQIKNTIRVLIQNQQLSEAEDLIREYESIVENDVEITFLKSEIVINKNLQ